MCGRIFVILDGSNFLHKLSHMGLLDEFLTISPKHVIIASISTYSSIICGLKVSDVWSARQNAEEPKLYYHLHSIMWGGDTIQDPE